MLDHAADEGHGGRGRTWRKTRRGWRSTAVRQNRAENLMIVDMLRNDLGRVAETGSVAVPLVRGRTLPHPVANGFHRHRPHPSLGGEILASLFPCASITGAPKVRTMQIIRELESQPRGVYTGAIGWIDPQRRASFNSQPSARRWSTGELRAGKLRRGAAAWSGIPIPTTSTRNVCSRPACWPRGNRRFSCWNRCYGNRIVAISCWKRIWRGWRLPRPTLASHSTDPPSRPG